MKIVDPFTICKNDVEPVTTENESEDCVQLYAC